MFAAGRRGHLPHLRRGSAFCVEGFVENWAVGRDSPWVCWVWVCEEGIFREGFGFGFGVGGRNWENVLGGIWFGMSGMRDGGVGLHIVVLMFFSVSVKKRFNNIQLKSARSTEAGRPS